MNKPNPIVVNDMNSILATATSAARGSIVEGSTRALADTAREVFRRFGRTDIVVSNASPADQPRRNNDGDPALCIPQSAADVAANITAAANGSLPGFPLVKSAAGSIVNTFTDIIKAVRAAGSGAQIVCDHSATARQGQTTARLLKRPDLSFAVAGK